MKIISSLVILALLTTISMGKEIEIKIKKYDDSFCKKTDIKDSNDNIKEINFCIDATGSYPLIQSMDRKLKEYMQNAITTELKKKVDAKEYILSKIKENMAREMNHESSLSIEVLSLTPKTFSLETLQHEEFGGPHGLGTTSFINYDRSTGKKLIMDDLFVKGYKSKFLKIVEKEYRKQMHLKSSDSLSDKANWSENKFVLSENIGISKDGLEFDYNSYEIKSYADGPTNFIVSYNLLKSIIKPNSYLSPFLETASLRHKPKQHFNFFDFKSNLELDVQRVSSSEIKLTVSMRNQTYLSSSASSTLSVSFPQLEDKADIYKYEKNNFSKVLIYPKRSLIYNFKKKKAIKSSYLLVEGEAKKWEYNEEKKLTIHLNTSSDMKTLIINLRTVIKEKKKTITIPFSGIEGQQGTANYQVKLNLK